jgi:hypothetical protein
MARSNLELPRWPDEASNKPAKLNPDGILGGIALTAPGASGVDFLMGPQIRVSQRRWGDPRRESLGDPSTMPDSVATPEQVSETVSRVQTLPEKLHGWEWSSSHSDKGWTDWATMRNAYESSIQPGGDINLHVHVPTASRQETERNYYPGPKDHLPARDYQKPAFILTPDRNTLLQFGVRNHAYFVEPVWQRPGTTNTRDYRKWKPTGRDW